MTVAAASEMKNLAQDHNMGLTCPLAGLPFSSWGQGGEVEKSSSRAILVENFKDIDKHHLLNLGSRDIMRH